MVTTAVRVKDTDKIGPEAGARGTAWAAVHIEVHTMAAIVAATTTVATAVGAADRAAATAEASAAADTLCRKRASTRPPHRSQADV